MLAVKQSDECNPLHLKWADRVHQGGDAWLGDCSEVAGVHTEMEYGFYPQPPVADLFHLYSDAVAFHGIEDHGAFHAARDVFAQKNASGRDAQKNATDPRCVPVFVDHRYASHPTSIGAACAPRPFHRICLVQPVYPRLPLVTHGRYTCLPHFIIGGVPKAGTTSLYKYLMQHPEVLPAKDKELTFWGNFFTPKRRPGREEVTTRPSRHALLSH